MALLGLARRAGRLVAGTETVAAAVRHGQVALLIVAADLSAATRERLARLADAHHVPMIVALDRARLGTATGYPGRGVYGVTERNLARAVAASWAAVPAGGRTEGGVCHS
ncbi:MAG: L7Ae/L30e/S12e/Gadd45 family ribosomal protein [Bacteroidota bacterium]